MSDSPSPIERAAAELRKLGITLRQMPGEYEVNLTGGPDENALTADTLEEAVELGRDMAKTLALALAAASRGRRPRKPLRMTPKAVRRRKIKAHNYPFARAGAQETARGRLTDHNSVGGFGERRACWRRGAWNCSPYCRTIAAAGLSRIPTAPRSSMKAHSAAIRLTTSSAVNIGAIPLPQDVRCPSFTRFGLNVYRSRTHSFGTVIPEIDIWRAANLMLKRYCETAQAESEARAAELAADGDYKGEAVWRRITDAVAQLANKVPPGPVH